MDIPIRSSWACHGQSTVIPWAVHGLPMGCPWDAHGLSVGCPWHGEQSDIYLKDTKCMDVYPCSRAINTSREVHEARRPHTCGRPCAFEEKKRKHNHEKISAKKSRRTHNTHRNRRPRPPRDGVQRNTPHALAHTCPLPQIPGLWKSAWYSSHNQ